MDPKKLLEVDARVSGEDLFTAVPKADTLSSIHALSKIMYLTEGKAEELKQIAADEVRYLRAAATALSKSHELREAFGTGYEGLMKLTPVLKEKYGQYKTDAMLHTYLKTDELQKILEPPSTTLTARPSTAAFIARK